MNVTREEFEARYAGWSGSSWAHLQSLGRMSAPCNCDSPDCQGWQMLSVDILDEEELSVLPQPYQTRARELQKERATAAMGTKGRP